jgi:hypothetical protein
MGEAVSPINEANPLFFRGITLTSNTRNTDAIFIFFDSVGFGQGVIGAYSGHDKIALHQGALVALQEHAQQHLYPGMRVCFASSATTPFAEQIGRATLKLLEVLPGMSVWDVVMRDWDGQDVNQIGRQPPLSRCVVEWECVYLVSLRCYHPV